jgi:hypothetical protein
MSLPELEQDLGVKDVKDVKDGDKKRSKEYMYVSFVVFDVGVSCRLKRYSTPLLLSRLVPLFVRVSTLPFFFGL